MTASTAILSRAQRLLLARLEDLAARLEAGDAMQWPAFLETITVVTQLEPRLAPGGNGELITTADMARRLGVSPKTLLRRRKRGEVAPAIQERRLLRWRVEAR